MCTAVSFDEFVATFFNVFFNYANCPRAVPRGTSQSRDILVVRLRAVLQVRTSTAEESVCIQRYQSRLNHKSIVIEVEIPGTQAV